MKIKCKVCRKETEIDELEYTPSDKIVVECQRCGNELEAIIPPREEEPAEKPKIRVVENDLKSVWYGASNTNSSSNIPNQEEKKRTEPKPSVTTTTTTPPQPTITTQNQQRTASSTTPPPPLNVYTPAEPSGSKGKTILFVILSVCVVGGIVIWLVAGRSSGGEAYAVDSVFAVEEVAEAVAPAEAVRGSDYNIEDYYDEVDTVVAVAAEVVEAPAKSEEVTRVFIPVISSTTSSEAYDVYAPYVTDNKFGDGWATTDLVQNAIRNNMVDVFIKGDGDIEGYPLSIDAVILKDGRMYGRYLNEYNGVKLDINGVFDANNDLIIKLGHKSETSYWVLKNEGLSDDLLHFKGTWGKSNKSTSLRLRATNQQ